jgi:hypothetical protein
MASTKKQGSNIKRKMIDREWCTWKQDRISGRRESSQEASKQEIV